jgi:hypothetical protein
MLFSETFSTGESRGFIVHLLTRVFMILYPEMRLQEQKAVNDTTEAGHFLGIQVGMRQRLMRDQWNVFFLTSLERSRNGVKARGPRDRTGEWSNTFEPRYQTSKGVRGY